MHRSTTKTAGVIARAHLHADVLEPLLCWRIDRAIAHLNATSASCNRTELALTFRALAKAALTDRDRALSFMTSKAPTMRIEYSFLCVFPGRRTAPAELRLALT